MKIIIYSAKDYEQYYFDKANQAKHELYFFPEGLSLTTVDRAKGFEGVCCFVTDNLNETVIKKLAEYNIKLIALRSAGYDHVDMKAAKACDITVVRVPDYSPQAVAEFAVGLLLALTRKIPQSYQRGLKFNFSLDGLLGFNLYHKTVGIIGTGQIGTAFAKIMHGFGCHLLAYDPIPNAECLKLGVNYLALEQLLRKSDIISLHCLLNNKTRYMINKQQLSIMKKGVVLINTGRGALINTKALIDALETGQVGYAGLDVYEYEKGLFFIDHHGKAVEDENFLKLLNFPNVLITPHQAFFTDEAVTNIAKATITNFTAFEKGTTVNQI